MNSILRVKLTAAVLLAVSCTLAHAAAPPNAVNYTNLGQFAGTWTGKCTQTGYVNPDIPNDLACGISLNEFFTYDFSVTFGPNPNQYSFTTGTFSRIGQNVSFTSDRVNQTTYALSASGTAVSTDIGNGGSRCVNMTWADGSMSSFLATIVRSVPANYGVYLEEGQRQFTRSGITATWLDCPFDSNQPQNCDPSSNIFSYTCYAIINLPDKIV